MTIQVKTVENGWYAAHESTIFKGKFWAYLARLKDFGFVTRIRL